jgi:hypothetical protein
VRLKDDALAFEITPSAPSKAKQKNLAKPSKPRARRTKDGVTKD